VDQILSGFIYLDLKQIQISFELGRVPTWLSLSIHREADLVNTNRWLLSRIPGESPGVNLGMGKAREMGKIIYRRYSNPNFGPRRRLVDFDLSKILQYIYLEEQHVLTLQFDCRD
jgi:hypothetical protein